MLTSLALIFLVGLLFGAIFNRLKLPGLLGMILTGIILSPYALNLLDDSILEISADLRKLALVIILTRAGLSLNIADLKKVGRPAVLMCFVPAILEIIGVILIAPKLFGVTVLEAAIMGSVLAAVSPAVIVPRMIKLTEEGYGKKRSIPQLILVGASVDDVFVMVIFTSLTALASTGVGSAASFLQIPVSIVMGCLMGSLTGILLIKFFKTFHMRDSVKILIIISLSFLMLELENQMAGRIPMSGLLAIMSIGIAISQGYHELSARLSAKYNRIWVAAEVILFVLVGATVNVNYVIQAGILAACVVVIAMFFRMAGVYLSLLKTEFQPKEKLFCMMAYTPKATVQAAIGGVPLAMGLACGEKVLMLAIISILITAPFGAVCMDRSYKKLLEKD